MRRARAGVITGRRHGGGVADLDAEVIDGAALAGLLEQHEFEGRIGDGEVGVALTPLGWRRGEQPRVEVDGGIQVFDVEGQLDS